MVLQQRRFAKLDPKHRFGFSPAARYPGLGPRELGDAFDALMHQLGYPRYAVHSTDLGWLVGSWMAGDHASNLIAHSSDFWFNPPNATDLERYARGETTAEENSAIEGTCSEYRYYVCVTVLTALHS